MARPDVLANPIRMRVVLALVGGRELTTAEIAKEMPDVPTPTLYRHIAALSDADVLVTVSERRVRGAVERTLALRDGSALIDRASAAGMTDDEKSVAFGIYCAGLMAAYDGYLAHEGVAGPLADADWDSIDWPEERPDAGEAGKEAAGYRTLALYLDNADLVAMATALKAALEPYMVAAPDKQRVLFSTVFIPT